MAFIGIMLLYLFLMAMFGMMGLGVVGLILLVVSLILRSRAKKRGENRQTLFLLLAVLGGLLMNETRGSDLDAVGWPFRRGRLDVAESEPAAARPGVPVPENRD